MTNRRYTEVEIFVGRERTTRPGTAALFTADATIKKKKERKERKKRERWRAHFSRRDRRTALIEDEIYERSAIAKSLIYIYGY